MKFDLHCHTKAGSIDAKVSTERYAEILQGEGFQGMLVTDHDSYKGYRQWKNNAANSADSDFVVLEGIEYDTKDAGHFLVIMPDNIRLRVLQVRGMSLDMLIKIVHHFGGILGPAHPFGTKSSSAMFFKKVRQNPKIFNSFDFVEGFNTCESPKSNRLAQLMAERYGKPCTGGSDSHSEACIGMAFTEIDAEITCNNDLIDAVKSGKITSFGGTERAYCARVKHKNAFYSVWGFKAYNRGLGFIFTPYRRRNIKKLAMG